MLTRKYLYCWYVVLLFVGFKFTLSFIAFVRRVLPVNRGITRPSKGQRGRGIFHETPLLVEERMLLSPEFGGGGGSGVRPLPQQIALLNGSS